MGLVCPSSGCVFLPQPSDVETESEEYESLNDTETDVEFEEQDGIVMVKESPDLQVSTCPMLVLGTPTNTGLEGRTSVLVPLAAEGVSGVSQTTLNFVRSLTGFVLPFYRV